MSYPFSEKGSLNRTKIIVCYANETLNILLSNKIIIFYFLILKIPPERIYVNFR